ncbi:TPA: type I-E CRISPR-associated protein Cas7/Cse4/CasC [Escherichia coli]|nr:type I-E CRISPR-associated protein Cas7/Cse4/CasC [Escherichia coli]ELG47398.1 CRISPR type I-e/-associated protein casa/cse1 [Escherichia coli KTE101]EEV8093430.1 type I-E CRISPR-associated protein Cas7/Cse4/CasC [Escherichia coli]EEW4264259.1 type I-E CRISPR-associated protein Cas7/Cse4/CasC [Escherichia coli]EEW4316911.1 type I-E CRISPR-associated protein Cas7/Cse4/CasC [Escherichia coli]
MNSFSLLTTPWLPVRFKDGTTGKLAPVDLADENVVDIAAPRADLQGAVWQFLLGLLQTSFAPKDHRRWDDIWEDGLEAEKLREALQSLEHAFQFGPDSPSFMQDFEALKGDKVQVASLLPEIPGAQTTKFNKDHFIKRGVTEHVCPHCSALALFSLQLNAPSGGKGYRTGLRGGGPMTTLIELQEYQGNQQTPLWRKLWPNVMPQDEADLPLPKKFDDLVFPWLGPTRTSELAGAVVTHDQVNKLQAYWGMPRRIRIDFNTTTVGNCDICGEQSDALLSLMTTKNYGANYAMWQHPLTPYRIPLKEGGEFYSVKPQPGGLIWRDWLGLIETGKSENNTELPALVVKLFNASSLKQAKVGLWGFGYDFDNMKARCWYEHHFPLLLKKKEGQIDIAMFGRMLANKPEFNVEAACQVAHAFGVSETIVEDDFFTAVDDLRQASEDAGAGHLGETGFGSALFYTYICIDKDLLVENLGGDEALANQTIRAFTEAALKVSPTGKQNSFASRAYASWALAEKGTDQPRSLAAAFYEPINGTRQLDVAVQRITTLRENMNTVYEQKTECASFDVMNKQGSMKDVLDFICA